MSYGVFLGNHCHSCAECNKDGAVKAFDGMIEHLKTARRLDFMFTFYPSNHVGPLELKCIYNYSLQKGDWRILCGLRSRRLNIRFTLWFDLSIAD